MNRICILAVKRACMVKSSSRLRANFFSSKYSDASIRRLVVVMDIDEAIVHAHTFGDENGYQRNFSVERVDDNKKDHKTESIRILMQDNVPVHVRFRPGLSDFLKDIHEIADIYAFTAGLKVYAKPVLDYIDPSGTIFKRVLYRYGYSSYISRLGY